MTEATTERPHLFDSDDAHHTADERGERAPVHQVADQWIAQFAQLGPTLTELGEEYEGEVKLVGKITYDGKLERWVASAKCDVPTIRTMKREPALAVAETGEDQGSAQLRLFNA